MISDTGDSALDEARVEQIRIDQQRQAPAPPTGEAGALAEAMQNQHVADEVNAAARRMYLGVPDDVMAKVSPFQQYVVVDMLTQTVNGTNYFFKIQVGEAEFIHLRVWLSLFGDMPQLVALKKGPEAAKPLAYFEPSD